MYKNDTYMFHIKPSLALTFFTKKKKHEKGKNEAIKQAPKGRDQRAALWNCGCKKVCVFF